ncbi:hypothetical protein Q8A67_025231 [Cirrhinus molitorella]|uniref:Uncharacterized protein n=1 Tax=Cirrhinus molitorella TaxID=172907 RepID=A0AA88NZL8_9TELE|nr:hypothetical protein Q8A67_025231 [Cirrhinus molitorella]
MLTSPYGQVLRRYMDQYVEYGSEKILYRLFPYCTDNRGDPEIKPKLSLIAGKMKSPLWDSQTCQVCQTTNERDCASSHPSAEGLLNTLNPAAPFS